MNGALLKKEENPTYLGVKLDKQLRMTEHINNIKEKASKRLNMVKRLASTTWGADKSTLRQLYLGYVRSTMDNCLPLQAIASEHITTSLDRVQNQGLRFICGGMRTTPTAACEIDANIEPLNIRRQRALLEAVERYKRMENNHPNRQTIDRWKSNQRIQQKSLLEVGKNLEEDYHLPTDRELITRCPGPPPWINIKQPVIQKYLLDKTINKATLAPILKTCALETIDSYPTSSIHAYTDGSAFKATAYPGCGINLKYPDGTTYNYCAPCGNICSNYEAEIIAIKTAVELVHQQFELGESIVQDMIVFTDSQSTLQALEEQQNQSSEIQSLASVINNLMSSFDINVILQWIPGHTNIPGNDKADHLAKQGSSKPQIDKPVSIQSIKQILKNNSREDWLNRWAMGTTGRDMYA